MKKDPMRHFVLLLLFLKIHIDRPIAMRWDIKKIGSQ